ncbi:A/G-specific adenine glycosylase [Acidaminobacterium chupaoyuni]
MPNLPSLSPLLLHWYDRHARVLPWRSDPTPYHVWLSEIMLQQTRVEAGLAYYNRFLGEVPDIRSLAELPEERLMKLWEGLGYYNRARNLQKAAGVVMSEYHGELPADPLVLKKLPGIGDYTAGAIASIAFGIKAPAVDGNVLRVFSRLSADGRDLSDRAVRREIETLVEAALPEERCGDFNQALMDLGATVCLPNGKPACSACPFAGLCEAHKQQKECEFPFKPPKKARPVEERTVLRFRFEDRFLLHQRPSTGLLRGQWELPALPGILTKEEVLDRLESKPLEIRVLSSAKHIFTHIEWKMIGYEIILKEKTQWPESRWVTKSELENTVALPSAFRAYIP